MAVQPLLNIARFSQPSSSILITHYFFCSSPILLFPPLPADHLRPPLVAPRRPLSPSQRRCASSPPWHKRHLTAGADEMALRVKSLIAFVLAVAFIFMTLNAIFPRADDRAADFIAYANPQTTEAAAEHEDAEGTAALHRASHDTANAHPIPQQQPTSPTSEWDIGEPVRQIYQDPTKEFRILVGVMSPFQKAARRYLMRSAYSQFPKDLPVDVWFVMGDVDPWNPVNAERVLDSSRIARDWENSTHHDVMLVDCTENMEQGKTYEYLKKVGREFSNRYTHVMKTDDDSFVNLPGNYSVSCVLSYFSIGASNQRTQRRTAFVLGSNL